MRIAVDARFLQADTISEYKIFTKEVMLRLAKLYAVHHFIFLSDTPIDPLINLPENVTSVVITPKPTNVLLYKWWYDIKVPLALKKYKTDVFICTSGLCSLTTLIPQVLFVHDLAFLHNAVFFSKDSLSFYRNFTRRFLKKAKVIAALSNFIKEEIISSYNIPPKKITVIGSAADSSFKPLHWEEREKVKEQYARGCEYFVFTGGLNPAKNLINLLKAFSIFKKWQKTNMKLVVIIHAGEYKEQTDKLNSYKYKNELLFAENLSKHELAHVTGGAYAMIFPSFYEGFGVAVLEAMQCEVPVITSSHTSMVEIAGDAALYANPENPQEIAEEMKRIFKDEQLRNKLISNGRERVKAYSWDKTSSLTWQLIQEAVSE